MEGKQFGLTFDETLDFATDKPVSGPYDAIIRLRVPREALRGVAFSRSIDPWHFPSGVYTVPRELLEAFSKVIREIDVVFR